MRHPFRPGISLPGTGFHQAGTLMPRNLDVSAIRSFLTVAEMGAVTRAATQLNLTQSAVSLQIKRLEETLGQSLFERNGRGVTLTAAGEQLVGYSRRLLAANDETWERMKAAPATGEINLGSPDDLLNPHVPKVMRDFAGSHPKVKVSLHSAQTVFLKERLARRRTRRDPDHGARSAPRRRDAGGEASGLDRSARRSSLEAASVSARDRRGLHLQ
jgi:DNA-binding transcriptional LysR family regulator